MAQPPSGEDRLLVPWWPALAGTALVGLAASWWVATQPPVPPWEQTWTEQANAAPEVVSKALWPVMQIGTVGGIVLVAVLVGWWRRDVVLAVATILIGSFAWFGARVVKTHVGRGRPAAYLHDLVVREGNATGLGYVSGHSAVAAAMAVVVAAVVPPSWRPVPYAVAAVVGLARIVYGVHLPADVIGGWSFGVLVALGGLAVVDAARPAAAESPARIRVGRSDAGS